MRSRMSVLMINVVRQVKTLEYSVFNNQLARIAKLMNCPTHSFLHCMELSASALILVDRAWLSASSSSTG